MSVCEEADTHYFNTGICIFDLTADSLLFAYNQHKVMRPASTLKIATAVSALTLLGADYEYRTRAYYTGHITSDSILEGDICVVGAFDPSYSYSDLQSLAQSIRALNIKGVRGSFCADISMKDSLLYGNGWCWDDVPSNNTPYLCPLMLERGQVAPFDGKYADEIGFHPAIYFLQTLGRELSDLGCDALPCRLKITKPSADFHLFYNKTNTISDFLPRMMKQSDNLYAESMFFHLARKDNPRWANWKDGARAVNSVIRLAGGDVSHTEIVDGSGVSLYNYITPATLVSLLRYAYNHESIFQVLISSLPVAGVDGTLRNRMKSAPAYMNVHAKTGSLSGVSSLAGYIFASNGHILAFSILNNGLLQTTTGRSYQDRICQLLCE